MAQRRTAEGRHADHGWHADLVAMLVGTLLWADLANRFVWIVLGATSPSALVGFYDDYLKLVVGNPGTRRALEVFLAVGGRSGDGRDAVLHRRVAGRDHAVSCRS